MSRDWSCSTVSPIGTCYHHHQRRMHTEWRLYGLLGGYKCIQAACVSWDTLDRIPSVNGGSNWWSI